MSQNSNTSTTPVASITRDGALALVAAARKAGKDIGIELAIAVTDAGGHLMAFERAEGAPFLTASVAIDKAWTAASFGLSTQVWNQVVAQPATAPLAQHPRVMAVGGGVPIVVGGKVAGGIGISGGNAQQDHDAAVAALEAQGFEVSQ
jgi:uncharacterized protein GlcG (DUF336 family)